MPIQFVFPCDPNCPDYLRDVIDICTAETTDSEIHKRERIHRAMCDRCRKYGEHHTDMVVY